MKLQPGVLYEIPHGGHNFYAVVGRGNDFLFVDAIDNLPQQGSMRFFLRLPVSVPSLRRAGWKRIGIVPVNGRIALFAKYINAPIGSNEKFLYDNETATLTKVSNIEAQNYETLASWDAAAHIPQVLDFFFYKKETPVNSLVNFSEAKFN